MQHVLSVAYVLQSILEKQIQLGRIQVRVELHQDMGSEVHSPMMVLTVRLIDHLKSP